MEKLREAGYHAGAAGVARGSSMGLSARTGAGAGSSEEVDEEGEAGAELDGGDEGIAPAMDGGGNPSVSNVEGAAGLLNDASPLTPSPAEMEPHMAHRQSASAADAGRDVGQLASTSSSRAARVVLPTPEQADEPAKVQAVALSRAQADGGNRTHIESGNSAGNGLCKRSRAREGDERQSARRRCTKRMVKEDGVAGAAPRPEPRRSKRLVERGGVPRVVAPTEPLRRSRRLANEGGGADASPSLPGNVVAVSRKRARATESKDKGDGQARKRDRGAGARAGVASGVVQRRRRRVGSVPLEREAIGPRTVGCEERSLYYCVQYLVCNFRIFYLL